MCVVKWVPSCSHNTKQFKNQTGRIQNFQNYPHKKLSRNDNHKQTLLLYLPFQNRWHVPVHFTASSFCSYLVAPRTKDKNNKLALPWVYWHKYSHDQPQPGFSLDSQVPWGQDRYRVDKSTKLCTAIAYCSTMNIRGGAQCKYATEAC